jgi:phosphoribosyl-ATP pyrophosphohydrolase
VTKIANLNVIADLADRISERRTSPAEISYTARLLREGVAKCAKKFGEEAVELALAAALDDKPQIRSEAADALYHLLVLLEASNVPLYDVLADLEDRMKSSGFEEKASRKRP